MSIAELALSVARSGHVAGLVSLLGVLLFRAFILPPASGNASWPDLPRLDHAIGRLAGASLAFATLGGAALLLLVTAQLTQPAGLAELGAGLEDVARYTQFGQLLMLRFALLLMVAAALAAPTIGRRRLAALLAAGALALQAEIGHAGALSHMEGALLRASIILHVVAAGAWLGMLAPLLLLWRAGSRATLAAALNRFSPVGMICVAVLAGTALLQGWLMVGGWHALYDTGYGQVALAKLVLFLSLVLLALVNRLILVPALARARGEGPGALLQRSILAEIGLGCFVLLAAGILASLPPVAGQG